MSIHADGQLCCHGHRGANLKSLHCFATGGEGVGATESLESRADSLSLAAPPEAAGSRVPQVFLSTLYDPTLAPENPGQRRSRCARYLCQIPRSV